MLNAIQIIDKKRRGQAHTEAEIKFLISEMMAGRIPDYQLSAWLMAAVIQDLNLDETAWLTDAFVRSGTVLDLSKVNNIVVDKHSTGGVGDKTTLVLIPLLAAAGVAVAKLSGRGLGFTGGTADKLEAIPGFHVALTNEQFIQQIQKIGVAISSPTQNLAPADARLYALRDVTATVDHIPLIAASVVSKKIAAGAQVIVLDIKYGRGAFMKTPQEAQQLAQTCREIGKRLGKTISTVISNMNKPLGYAIGHSVEISEVIQTLKGNGPADLVQLCLTLGAVALVGAGKAASIPEGEQKLQACLQDGSALAKFKELIAAQGGDVHILEDPELLPQPDRVVMLPAPESGYIVDIDALKIAQTAKLLGAGRITKEDEIHLGVGIVLHKNIGEPVEKGESLLELYATHKDNTEALELAQSAVTIAPTPVELPSLIYEISSLSPSSAIR